MKNPPLRWIHGACLVGALLFAGATAAPASAGVLVTTSERSEAYREGRRALEDERWDDAARAFAAVIRAHGSETDAGLYWKAYADWKAGRKKLALEGLGDLRSDFPDSSWADDAGVLEQEIRGKSAKSDKGDKGGKSDKARAVDEDEDEDDADELKLHALDGLLSSNPDRAVPVLERLLAGNASPRVKERALFVLSQADSPRARAILVRMARTGEPLALRREAIRTLGIAGDDEDIAELAALVREKDVPYEVRETVLEAYLIAGRQTELAALAKSDPDPRLRARAVETLGAMGATPVLRQLWTTEKDPQARRKLLEAFGIAGDVETLSRIAREAGDSEIRHKAIEGLGISGGAEIGELLRDLYAKFSDPDDKRKVLEALMIHGDAHSLVDLFRSERNPALKRAILQQLSVMNDPEATKVLLDVLEDKQ